MAKTSSKKGVTAGAVLARLIKVVMVAVLVPLALGLLLGVLEQLEFGTFSGATFRQWMTWGFFTYLGIHILLYRPVAVFQASHRVFSTIAVWLFGGQVTSVGGEGDGKGKGAKGPSDPGGQGSTLVAFSPYVIPVYAVLVSAAGWLVRRWTERTYLDGPVTFLIGVMIGFHWLMTADALQEQRERWHLETYLLAVGLVFVVTLLVGAACLPWAIPEFSFVRALSEGFVRAQGIYEALVSQLFFE